MNTFYSKTPIPKHIISFVRTWLCYTKKHCEDCKAELNHNSELLAENGNTLYYKVGNEVVKITNHLSARPATIEIEHYPTEKWQAIKQLLLQPKNVDSTIATALSADVKFHI